MNINHFRSGLSGFLFGGLWGGIGGAILLGSGMYFSDSSSTLGGPDRNWAWLFMIFGFVCGLIVGAVLGAIIGATHATPPMGLFVGLVIGVLLGIALGPSLLAFAGMVSCSILGWLLASMLQTRYQPR